MSQGEWQRIADPRITGTASAGGLLTAHPGTWSPTPERVRYSWHDADHMDVTLGAGPNYRPTKADVGRELIVVVTVEHRGYVPHSWGSDAVLVRGPLPLTATPKPKIGVLGGGTAKVGKKLAVRAGSWKPYKVTVKYRWLRNGKAIRGATKTKYKLTRKDRGKRISVRVTGSKPGYATATKTSSAKRVSRAR